MPGEAARRLLVPVLALGCWTALPCAAATTYTVKNANDSGPDSLRDAVGVAVHGDTIQFDPFFFLNVGGRETTITLLTPIAISQNITIEGANIVAVSGNGAHRIFQTNGSYVTINALTIRNGAEASGDGGGILNTGTLMLNDVTVVSCSAANGGGIRNEGNLVMDRCTVAENVASGGGGGVDVPLGTLTLTNCTVSGNVAGGAGGGISLSSLAATLTVKYCTIAENLASTAGGGVHVSGFLSTATLEASILATNGAQAGPDCSGTVTSNGNNVVGSSSGCTLAGVTAGDVIGQDAKLGSLRSNGGTFQRTHALLPGSPAIDKGGSFCSAATDQRGLARAQDGDANGTALCDAGAYEAQTPIVVTSLADPGDSGTCTLRQALTAAITNTATGTCAAGTLEDDFVTNRIPDRITFAVTGTVPLASPLIVNKSVLVDGPGADRLTIGKAAPGVQISFEEQHVSTFVLSGLTVHFGSTQAAPEEWVRTSNAYNDTLVIDRCLFRDTPLYASPGRVEISRSTFANTLGVYDFAVKIVDTVAVMRDATVVGSKLRAIHVQASFTSVDLTLVNCTLTGTSQAGLYVFTDLYPAAARYRATVFAGFGGANVVGETPFAPQPQLVSLGHNVSSDGTGNLTATGDLASTDPKLGVLAYNGGPVPTVNLKAGSPAIAHVPLLSTRTAVDERGVLRKLTGSDVGAIERIPGGDVNGDGAINVSDVLYLINFLFAGGPVPVGEADVNGDAAISVSDVLYLINRLFAGGPAPV